MVRARGAHAIESERRADGALAGGAADLILQERAVAHPGELNVGGPHERGHQQAHRALIQVEELLEDDPEVPAPQRSGARIGQTPRRGRGES